jgi:hypothetical protein
MALQTRDDPRNKCRHIRALSFETRHPHQIHPTFMLAEDRILELVRLHLPDRGTAPASADQS